MEFAESEVEKKHLFPSSQKHQNALFPIVPSSRATKSFLLTGPSRVDEPLLSSEACLIDSKPSGHSLGSGYEKGII
jgi:hypothetical protein